jgi:hypothetical protein
VRLERGGGAQPPAGLRTLFIERSLLAVLARATSSRRVSVSARRGERAGDVSPSAREVPA